MKTLLIAVIAGLLPLVSGMAEVSPMKPVAEISQPMMPTGNWSMVFAAFLPTIPPGWQLNSAQPVIYQGNSMTRTLMFLYNPTTRQSAVWVVDL